MAHPIRYDDILVPTDGSETANAATQHAVSIASTNDARIHALYVLDTRITMAAEEDTRRELAEGLEAEGSEAVAAVLEAAEAAGLEAESTIAEGTPSKEILEYVDEQGIELVVMGTAGKSPREKLIRMGSVSERVVDAALVPVLVVPE